MSDEINKNNDAPQDPPAPQESAPEKAPEPKRGSAIGWLSLLLTVALALLVGGASFWLYPQVKQAETALNERVSQLEATQGREAADLRAVENALTDEFESGLGELDSARAADAARLADALVTVEAQLAEQREELSRFGSNDRTSWLLAEAEYLLRLANQRLVMAGDAVAARALLMSADTVLREIDDAGLYEVRAAVAADTAAVRAVPVIDVEGIYLRLSALIEQADTLVIFTMPEQTTSDSVEAVDDWQGRLQQGYENALLKLSDYIVIRRRDVPIQSLMDPQWEGLVRQNLRMLLEQSQVALLPGNGTLYRESLERAEQWLAQFADSDPATASAMAREIRQLADTRVEVAMPDIARSLRALDAAMAARLQRQQGGGD